MQLIIDTTQTKLEVKNKSFFISNETTERMISPKRISSIAITTHCQVNTAVIKLAANQQIPIYFYNNFGTIQARMCSPHLINLASLRRKQLLFYDQPEATNWVLNTLTQKTLLQIKHLQQLSARKPRHKTAVETASQKMTTYLNKTKTLRNKHLDDVRKKLLGIEGNLSKVYFKHLALFMNGAFSFDKRSRRPATDLFNAGLNYLYGMTYSLVENGIYAKGLDPFAGFFHTDYYRKPSLVFDLIEPVRPLIDKMWIKLILDKKINEEHFIPKEQGYWLSKAGKRMIIPSFNAYQRKRIKVGDNYYSLKNYIYTLSNDLGNLIEASL